MAGVGFSLRRVLARDASSATLPTYLYAGLVGSGPWVLSIVSVMLIGLFSVGVVAQAQQFLATVTYLMAASLILTGGVQLCFGRFIADRLFERQEQQLRPNLLGLLLLVTTVCGLLAWLPLALLFEQPFSYRLLVQANFVVLCDLWLVVVFMFAIKARNRLLAIILGGYASMLASAWLLRQRGLDGLLLALLIGHAGILFALLHDVLRRYPAPVLVAFDFLRRRKIFPGLLVSGLCYNLGVWIDKLIFWFNPATSSAVIGPLRISVLYDLPIFLAYLAIIPAMAVFLVRVETDFAEWHRRLYRAIREGDTLPHIAQLKEEMTLSIRQALLEICKVQGLTVVSLLLLAPRLLAWLGISNYYLPLFYIDLLGVSAQVVFMALLNVLFYLDERTIVLRLCGLFVLLNTVLTVITLQLGPSFFGYGFTVSLLICVLLGLAQLTRALEQLEYRTFMLQS